jgi:hypothetical protein
MSAAHVGSLVFQDLTGHGHIGPRINTGHGKQAIWGTEGVAGPAKERERREEKLPRQIHAAWFVVVGIVLIGLVVLIWTFAP